MTTAERNKSTSTVLYDEAMVALDAGDLVQASEKLWEAAEQALKSIAKSRGWKHESDRDLYKIMSGLRMEIDSRELRGGFDAACHLHFNIFDHEWTQSEIRARAPAVRRFIDIVADLRSSEA